MGAVKRRREPAFDAPPPRRRVRNAPHHPRPAAESQRKVIKRKRESWFVGFKERVSEFWESKRRWLSLTAIVLALFAAAGVYGFFAGGHASRLMDATSVAIAESLGEAGFQVDDVTLNGRHRADKAAIIEALGVSRGDPLLAFDAEAARERLLAIDWVKDARIMRRLPDTLSITITEFEPFAIWQEEGRLVLIDREGAVITADSVAQFRDLPMIVGKGGATHAAALIDTLRQFGRIAPQVRAAVFVREGRWNLHMTNDIVIMLPETGVERALGWLDRKIVEEDILKRAIVSIDLRFDGKIHILPQGGAAQPGDGEAT